jgi:hypothetical protein
LEKGKMKAVSKNDLDNKKIHINVSLRETTSINPLINYYDKGFQLFGSRSAILLIG